MGKFFSIFYLIFSYLLGSIPFGFIFTFLFAKKNILEIGWKKTSGSNVFKNVGFLPGILTGILDLLKGFFAVYFAQKLGFSNQIQILAGILAIIGHNWSIYLKFAGGRGIGTFIGASLALDPKILGLSFIFFALLAIIWNASIGTILFLISAISLSLYFGHFWSFGIFTLLSLIPIFIKRLSPIKDLKKEVFFNRLIFDNDNPCLDLRIKRIIEKFTPHHF
jgi:glycerol-3-phosphate acyltransferase PlsY